MLSYQHAFHAGNHADVLKHYVLLQTLESLCKKEKPFAFFDTHSGSALYNLEDIRNKKTGEGNDGIIRLLNAKAALPSCLKSYADFAERYVSKNLYPGSPEIERCFMRPNDILTLSEIHPQEIELLKSNMKDPLFKKDDECSIQIHNRNGFEMLKALTPPLVKRGAVLIDPSYEELSDFDDVSSCVTDVFKKWTNGTYLIWYPLLVRKESHINQMIQSITEGIRFVNSHTDILNLTVCVRDKARVDAPNLYGSGMLVVNPAWSLCESGKEAADFLTSFFYQKNGR